MNGEVHRPYRHRQDWSDPGLKARHLYNMTHLIVIQSTRCQT